MSEWQTIETAPRDGTACLVAYVDGYPPMVGRFGYIDEKVFQIWLSCNCIDNYYGFGPTHWMPLPEPPK